MKYLLTDNGSPKVVPNSKGRKRKPGSKSLGGVLKCTDSLFLDLVSKCLEWDPEKRLKPDEAEMHPFLRQVRFLVKCFDS